MNENNVMQEPKISTTNIVYGDELSENIKSVIRSNMTEDEKVNVIIGLCCQRTNYIKYPWNQPQIMYTGDSTGSYIKCYPVKTSVND